MNEHYIYSRIPTPLTEEQLVSLLEKKGQEGWLLCGEVRFMLTFAKKVETK